MELEMDAQASMSRPRTTDTEVDAVDQPKRWSPEAGGAMRPERPRSSG